MKISEKVRCNQFPCTDIDRHSYLLPSAEIDTGKIRILMITEAPPSKKEDYFYAPGDPFFLQTTVHAFRDAGADVSTMQDIIDLGVYITTAIKCGKARYSIASDTVKNCSQILVQELTLFPNIKVFLLMGDVAIKIMNGIWKRLTGKRVIPVGSTYKIRGQPYFFEDKRIFPSYTPAGKNFLIEKSKRRMIAEDINEALNLAYVR